VYFSFGKTIGVDFGKMKNFFTKLCLFSNNYVEDIQALGRDRDFFPQSIAENEAAEELT
jgi:hypothetical protein